MQKNAIITKHKLDFEAARWPIDERIMLFRIGTCEGQYLFVENSICILSVVNSVPGNGHLDDVFEWFEFASKKQGHSLKVLAIMNEGFKKHLIEKRGFVDVGDDNVEKYF